MAIRMLIALASGLLVAWIYRASHGREQSDTRSLSATLVLLSILIAMVSMVIGDSVAKAFSLVGALSIVRFRTVVDDTRDTAFVIFAVIVGMAAGADAILVPLIGIPVVGAAAIGMSRFAPASGRRTNGTRANRMRTLVVKLGLGSDPTSLLAPAFERLTVERCLIGTATARQGTALEVTYELRLRPDVDELTVVNTLNQIEGVIGVELRAL
ncbi:MAG: DUF4956 domain-containing protein [Phycisphaerae bacterium]|nr:DUF4956 domain-containing protein [Phycisphaerae bacterium]